LISCKLKNSCKYITKFSSQRFFSIFAAPDRGYRKGFFVNLFPDPSVPPLAGHLPLKKGGAFFQLPSLAKRGGQLVGRGDSVPPNTFIYSISRGTNLIPPSAIGTKGTTLLRRFLSCTKKVVTVLSSYGTEWDSLARTGR